MDILDEWICGNMYLDFTGKCFPKTKLQLTKQMRVVRQNAYLKINRRAPGYGTRLDMPCP